MYNRKIASIYQYEAPVYYCGIKPVRIITPDCMSDPILVYRKLIVDVYDVEDYFFEEFLEDGGKDEDGDAFAAYMRDHADDLKAYITETATRRFSGKVKQYGRLKLV